MVPAEASAQLSPATQRLWGGLKPRHMEQKKGKEEARATSRAQKPGKSPQPNTGIAALRSSRPALPPPDACKGPSLGSAPVSSQARRRGYLVRPSLGPLLAVCEERQCASLVPVLWCLLGGARCPTGSCQGPAPGAISLTINQTPDGTKSDPDPRSARRQGRLQVPWAGAGADGELSAVHPTAQHSPCPGGSSGAGRWLPVPSGPGLASPGLPAFPNRHHPGPHPRLERGSKPVAQLRETPGKHRRHVEAHCSHGAAGRGNECAAPGPEMQSPAVAWAQSGVRLATRLHACPRARASPGSHLPGLARAQRGPVAGSGTMPRTDLGLHLPRLARCLS